MLPNGQKPKMIYVFHVDTGTTFTYEEAKYTHALVSDLKDAIERDCSVAPSQQVLLMSGGVNLEPNVRILSYASTNSDNPIYLFSKAAIESEVPPRPSVDYGSDVDLQMQLESSLDMPPTYNTLVIRTQLARRCGTLGQEQTRICERLVYDQHLQQQGWAAVVANLEDITQTFQARAEMVQQNFAAYLSERQMHMEILQNFNADLKNLENIPILPALRAHAEGFLRPDDPQEQQHTNTGTDDNTIVDATSTINDDAGTDALNLLKWISAKDNQSSLGQVAEQCSRGLEQFDERAMETLKTEINSALEGANQQDMKEIKGVCERLFALEQLLVQIRKIMNEQMELTHCFNQNKERLYKLKDESVLPDLSLTHRKQIEVMLKNHQQMRDIRRRCKKAKEELSVNIHTRLKWIMCVENKMLEIDSKLVMYHESLRRLRRQLEILRQIHLAPAMYVSAIAEVVRRRIFSKAFLVWASNLACQLLSVHNEEIERRREFQSRFEGHFLNTLFPGLEDVPPPFATEAPTVFDNGLPKLNPEDMELLKQKLPDLASSVSIPALSSIAQSFFSKSITESSSDGSKKKESSSMRVDEVLKEQETGRPPLISDRGGFESETDTEEFENIGQATMDSKLTSYGSTKQQTPSRQKQMEENLSNTREEVERLRAIIRNLKSAAMGSLHMLRRELNVIKEQALVDRESVVKLIDDISEEVTVYTCTLKERAQEIAVKHDHEISDLKKMLQTRDEQIHNLERALMDKESENSEQERLILTMRQKFEGEQQEMKKLQTAYRQIEERLEQSHADQEAVIQQSNDARVAETNTLRDSLEKCQDRIRELEEKMASAEVEYQKVIKEESDRLQSEYKAQYETMRSRFKLMHASTMERSPSDSSLERIERVDVLELSNETIVSEPVEVKRDEFYRAIQDERLKMSQTNSDLGESMKSEKSDDVKVSESKKVRLETDSDLLSLPTKLECLEADNKRLDSELRAFRESKEEMEEKLEALTNDKIRLENELRKERISKRTQSAESMSTSSIVSSQDANRDKEMNLSIASVAISTGRVDAATSTERCRRETSSSHSVRDKLSKSVTTLGQQGKITYISCNAGDTVLVTWDQAHRNYTLLQDSPTFYFLNSDCIADLGLKLGDDGQPVKPYVIAEVIEKEYCSARKQENRYRVPQGTKFFRVRVKPLQRPITAGKH